MTSVSRTAEQAPAARPAPAGSDPVVLRAQVELARERLGDTIEELAAKADVKAMARRKSTEMHQRVTAARDRAGQRVTRTAKQSRWAGAVALAAALAVAGASAASRRRGCGKR